MTKNFDVCVRGAGLVGQTLALLLARERLRVALVSTGAASAEHVVDIRAYALNAASRACLQSLRTWPQPPLVCPVREMRVFGDEGSQLQFGAAQQGVDALAWIAPAAQLSELAAQAIRFQPLIERFSAADAKQVQAPLVAVCEGKASSTRAAYGVAFDVQPYGMSAVAARVQCALAHEGVALQWFNGVEVLALLPLGDAVVPAQEAGAGGGNSVALVWSVSQERAAALVAMGAAEFEAQLQAACGDARGAMLLQGQRASWPLTLSRAQRMVGPGFALLGDAAHTVHPLAGQGLNLGLADALALASTLAAREYWRGLGEEKLLRRYERARAGAVAQMGALTHGLHSLFAHEGAAVQGLRSWGLRGFDRSGPLKAWAVRQAMGLT